MKDTIGKIKLWHVVLVVIILLLVAGVFYTVNDNSEEQTEDFVEKYGKTENLTYSVAQCLEYYNLSQTEKFEKCRNTHRSQNITS